jgi:DNA-binding PucR family transcriptional regulator
MDLPSLKKSRVIAGAGGLGRIVSSISVLETVDVDMLPPSRFQQGALSGSGMMITGFVNCPDDEARQCTLVRQLSECGEIGIILFYVGLCMPRVGEQLRELCDQLDFVLICMPEGDLSCRYAEVIFEVMEAIICDRMQYMHFTHELLGEISMMPKQQHSVDTMLQLISERLHLSLLMTDQNYQPLSSVSWSQSTEAALLRLLDHEIPPDDQEPHPLDQSTLLYHLPLLTDSQRRRELFLLKEGGPLRRDTVEEIGDMVRLAINLWDVHHDQVDITELFRAIIQDEPLKMRGLANIFGLDVSSLHTMGILRPEAPLDPAFSQQLQQGIRDILQPHFRNVVIGPYEDTILFFTDSFAALSQEQQLLPCIQALLEDSGRSCTITFSSQIGSTTDAAALYRQHKTYLQDARRIYPCRQVLHRQELEFAQSCRSIIEQGEDVLSQRLRVLGSIAAKSDGAELLHTLEVFLLDADSSQVEASRRMYLHKNTIKYRLARCSDAVGYHIGRLPDTLPLYEALAIRRMVAG